LDVFFGWVFGWVNPIKSLSNWYISTPVGLKLVRLLSTVNLLHKRNLQQCSISQKVQSAA